MSTPPTCSHGYYPGGTRKWELWGGAVCGICKGPIAAGKGKANAHTRCAKNWRPTKNN